MKGKDDSYPHVSVIMPVCNAGKYLSHAVESVLSQTFQDFELILVDDGSTDGSGMVCNKYAVNDYRVRVVHRQNGGICSARNVGLALVRGRWIAFCDHDDYCEPEWLATMVNAAEGTGLMVVKCGYSTFTRGVDGDVRFGKSYETRGDCTWDVREFVGGDGYLLYRSLACVLWNGLYRRDFWESSGFKFDESFEFGGEDCFLAIDILKEAGRGAWVGRSLYRHYMNEGVSTSASYHPELIGQYLIVATHEQKVFGFNSFPERYESFKQWSIAVLYNVMCKKECRLTMSEKSAWVQHYYDRLVGRYTRPVFNELHVMRRIGVWLLGHGFSRLYLLLRMVTMYRFTI